MHAPECPCCTLLNSMCGVLQFASSSFKVVVDKGGLDALMGEDTTDSEDAGGKLLTEVARLLCLEMGATYICVTLAQTHVLSNAPSGSSALALLSFALHSCVLCHRD